MFQPTPPGFFGPRPWFNLNWSSPASLRHNRRKLTRLQRWYLQQIDERVRDFKKYFGRTDTAEDDYRAVACMIAMACSREGDHDRDASVDLSFKDRFLQCRRLARKTPHGSVSYDGRCGQRRFCPYCNYLLRQEALLTYVPAFDRGRWYSMTVSSTTDVDMELDELTYSWDAVGLVVRALLDAEHFQGAYWTEELHLGSLYPDIRVLPHGHVLFHAEAEADEAAVQALAEKTFRRYFAKLECEHGKDSLTVLEPDIELKRLGTKQNLHEQSDSDVSPSLVEEGAKKDLFRWCDYLTKTVRVFDAYQAALGKIEDEERWRVNGNFEQFLSGFVVMLEEDSPTRKPNRKTLKDNEHPKKFRPRSRVQRHRLGTLHPGSRRFVGIRPAQRREHLHELEELHRKIVEERAASNREDDESDVEQ